VSRNFWAALNARTAFRPSFASARTRSGPGSANAELRRALDELADYVRGATQPLGGHSSDKGDPGKQLLVPVGTDDLFSAVGVRSSIDEPVLAERARRQEYIRPGVLPA
jgi:hypothetical protein